MHQKHILENARELLSIALKYLVRIYQRYLEKTRIELGVELFQLVLKGAVQERDGRHSK